MGTTKNSISIASISKRKETLNGNSCYFNIIKKVPDFYRKIFLKKKILGGSKIQKKREKKSNGREKNVNKHDLQVNKYFIYIFIFTFSI